MHRYEMEEKFWSIDVRGTDVHLAWGKIGTAGQSQVKSFASEREARDESQKLVRSKTKKGYALVSEASGAATSDSNVAVKGEVALHYACGDLDAEDDVELAVRWPEGVRAYGAIVPIALDGPGVWTFSQQTRTPSDDAWTPLFLVPASVADALASGRSATLATGLDPDRLLVLARCEVSELALETREAAAAWKDPLVAARSDEGAELVFAAARVPQLIALRVDDVCGVAWKSGVLPGATEALPEPAAKTTAKKKTERPQKADPALLAFDDAAPMADRVKATKAALKAPTAAFVERGIALQSAWPQPLRNAWFSGVNQAMQALRQASPPWDPTDALDGAVSAAGEIAFDPAVCTSDARVDVVLTFLGALASPLTPRAEAIVRALAWDKPCGEATLRARELLARLGHTETCERVAHMLTVPRHASVAVPVLLARADGAALAATQVGDAISDDVAAALDYDITSRPPFFDVAPWMDFLMRLAGARRERFALWVAQHGVHRAIGRSDAAVAMLLASEYRVWRDADLASELATFPPASLDESVLDAALDVAGSFDVAPVLVAAPRALARRMVDARIQAERDAGAEDPVEPFASIRARLG